MKKDTQKSTRKAIKNFQNYIITWYARSNCFSLRIRWCLFCLIFLLILLPLRTLSSSFAVELLLFLMSRLYICFILSFHFSLSTTIKFNVGIVFVHICADAATTSIILYYTSLKWIFQFIFFLCIFSFKLFHFFFSREFHLFRLENFARCLCLFCCFLSLYQNQQTKICLHFNFDI